MYDIFSNISLSCLLGTTFVCLLCSELMCYLTRPRPFLQFRARIKFTGWCHELT